MAHSYTPGLRVAERTTIRKQRILPIAGTVVVSQGDRVRAEDVVARAELPGAVSSVNVVNQLGITAGDIKRFMLRQAGDPVAEGDVIAETRPLVKWFKTVVRSPAKGVIETVSEITGQVLIRHEPRPVEVKAYVDGEVVEVIPREGVAVEATGALIQGIFGVGGEVNGEVAMACGAPDEIIKPGAVTAAMAGKIVVAGELVSSETYRAAAEAGVAALICGGVHDSDLRELLGYDIGVAITGHEPIRPTLIITEGFGHIAMARTTFELLRAHCGCRASANGATQIRAGVLRPEIVIPVAGVGPGATDQMHGGEGAAAAGLTVGSPVRIIRNPGFGRIGRVKSLPEGVVRIESEAAVRVLEVTFENGDTVTTPRANVEAIELK